PVTSRATGSPLVPSTRPIGLRSPFSGSTTRPGSSPWRTWPGTAPRSSPPDVLTPAEAARLIVDHCAPLPVERRPLKEALDLVLAEDVTSPIDLPGWDNSAMDGYAVRAADVAGATRDRRKTLRIVETVPAGRFPEQPLVPGAATRIFTGAPLLASGEEVVDLDQADEILAGRKIATSNSYTLFGLIRRAGGIPVELGIARDTKASLREHLAPAADADMLVTTGGVSVGEHDLVRDVLAELGCDMKLWRIRMRPGAPLGFGTLAGRPWLGRPGHPVSTMVTFE